MANIAHHTPEQLAKWQAVNDWYNATLYYGLQHNYITKYHLHKVRIAMVEYAQSLDASGNSNAINIFDASANFYIDTLSITDRQDESMKYNVIVDRSGKLLPGYFYELVVEDDWVMQGEIAAHPDGILAQLSPTNDQLGFRNEAWVRARLNWEDPKVVVHHAKECSANPEHVTRKSFRNLAVELDLGPHIPDLIFMDCDAEKLLLVTEALGKALETTGFSGYELHPVRCIPKPRFGGWEGIRELQFAGKNCVRHYSIVGAPNLCPWCGNTQIVCPNCGLKRLNCAYCDRMMWAVEKNKKKDDLHLVIEPWTSTRPLIIDGHRWDGSDFVYNGIDQGFHSPIVTKRVVDWLLSRHAAPFFARPMLVAVDKMTSKQRTRLEEIKSLAGPKR